MPSRSAASCRATGNEPFRQRGEGWDASQGRLRIKGMKSERPLWRTEGFASEYAGKSRFSVRGHGVGADGENWRSHRNE